MFDEQSQHDILYQLRDNSDWEDVTTRDEPWKSVKYASEKVSAELLRIARILAFVPPSGEFRSRQDIDKSLRLMKLVLRKMEMPEAAATMNDIGLLAQGRGNIRRLPSEVLKQFNNFRGWGTEDFQKLYSVLSRSKAASIEERVVSGFLKSFGVENA